MIIGDEGDLRAKSRTRPHMQSKGYYENSSLLAIYSSVDLGYGLEAEARSSFRGLRFLNEL